MNSTRPTQSRTNRSIHAYKHPMNLFQTVRKDRIWNGKYQKPRFHSSSSAVRFCWWTFRRCAATSWAKRIPIPTMVQHDCGKDDPCKKWTESCINHHVHDHRYSQAKRKRYARNKIGGHTRMVNSGMIFSPFGPDWTISNRKNDEYHPRPAKLLDHPKSEHQWRIQGGRSMQISRLHDEVLLQRIFRKWACGEGVGISWCYKNKDRQVPRRGQVRGRRSRVAEGIFCLMTVPTKDSKRFGWDLGAGNTSREKHTSCKTQNSDLEDEKFGVSDDLIAGSRVWAYSSFNFTAASTSIAPLDFPKKRYSLGLRANLLRLSQSIEVSTSPISPGGLKFSLVPRIAEVRGSTEFVGGPWCCWVADATSGLGLNGARSLSIESWNSLRRVGSGRSYGLM